MEPLVAEIIGLIEASADDPRLRWSPDRRTVQLVLSRLILDSGAALAAQGGRARFGESWRAAMAERGWVPLGRAGQFTRPRGRPAHQPRPPAPPAPSIWDKPQAPSIWDKPRAPSIWDKPSAPDNPPAPSVQPVREKPLGAPVWDTRPAASAWDTSPAPAQPDEPGNRAPRDPSGWIPVRDSPAARYYREIQLRAASMSAQQGRAAYPADVSRGAHAEPRDHGPGADERAAEHQSG